jgi:hypothetical protein
MANGTEKWNIFRSQSNTCTDDDYLFTQYARDAPISIPVNSKPRIVIEIEIGIGGFLFQMYTPFLFFSVIVNILNSTQLLDNSKSNAEQYNFMHENVKFSGIAWSFCRRLLFEANVKFREVSWHLWRNSEVLESAVFLLIHTLNNYHKNTGIALYDVDVGDKIVDKF